MEGASIDPFDGAKPRLLRRGREVPFRVNPEQTRPSGRGAEGLTLFEKIYYSYMI